MCMCMYVCLLLCVRVLCVHFYVLRVWCACVCACLSLLVCVSLQLCAFVHEWLYVMCALLCTCVYIRDATTVLTILHDIIKDTYKAA